MRLWAALVLAGCWRDPPPAAPEPPPPAETATLRPHRDLRVTCDRAIEHAFDVLDETDPNAPAERTRYSAALVASCERLGWSEELRRCMIEASTLDELDCRAHMTTEQVEDFARIVSQPP